ncbi:MAG: BlaI/MecI/CopY family transcriptional regulator [Pirellulales bacterium]|nr:BlaI/MecI/CopY family transcriptional regulator [Pirellulales bacterium]
MGKKPLTVTDAELAVLHVLWQGAPLPARAIAKQIYRNCSETEVATVRSMLTRLEAKKLVRRDRSLHVHLFSAAKTRTEICGEQVHSIARKYGYCSFVSLVTHLVNDRRISRSELEEVRRLLDQLPSLDSSDE